MTSQHIEKHGSWQAMLNFWLVDYNVAGYNPSLERQARQRKIATGVVKKVINRSWHFITFDYISVWSG